MGCKRTLKSFDLEKIRAKFLKIRRNLEKICENLRKIPENLGKLPENTKKASNVLPLEKNGIQRAFI